MNIIPDITVTAVKEILTIHSEKGRRVKMENRPFYGLSFCYEGKITYTHKGKTFVSDKNCAILLPKGESYSLYGSETGLFPLINFQCDDLKLDIFRCIPLINPEGYLKDFEKMKKLSIFDGNNLKIKSIFYDILSRLFSENTTEDNIISPAIRHIQNNYSDSTLNNDTLANLCNISEVYFRRIFKEKIGTSPKQYVLDIRIKRAKQLLETGNLSVTQIAEKCGFSGVYHFCRSFKTITGLTPTQFAKQSQKIGL